MQAGSQDYICKPFQPQEVLARIETQMRLYMGEMQQLQVGGMHVVPTCCALKKCLASWCMRYR